MTDQIDRRLEELHRACRSLGGNPTAEGLEGILLHPDSMAAHVHEIVELVSQVCHPLHCSLYSCGRI